MSLVTRCTACATVFKVAQDQLQVSDGWVRCGRCDTVFDALESLADQPLSTGDGMVDGRPTPAPTGESGDPWQATIDIDDLLKRRVEAQVVAPNRPDDEPAPSEPAGLDTNGLREVDPDPSPVVAAPAAVGTVSADDTPRAPAPDRAVPAPTAEGMPPVPRPAFVRQADREARWHSPAMRAALIGTSLILLTMLLAQVAFHHRDHLTARSPLAADLLASACMRWGCSIGAPRRLGDLVIEHSALARVPQRPDALQLSLRVSNRSDIELALPTVELSLTDGEGRLITRRALWPSDFGVQAPAVVPPGSELPLQLLFSTGQAAVSSYTVELFYP